MYFALFELVKCLPGRFGVSQWIISSNGHHRWCIRRSRRIVHPWRSMSFSIAGAEWLSGFHGAKSDLSCGQNCQVFVGAPTPRIAKGRVFFPLHELFHREVTVRQDKAWGESQREVHSFDTAEESLRFSPLQLSSKKYWAEPPKFDGAAFRHQLFYEMAMAEGYISGKSSWISKIAMVSTLWHRNWIQLLNFQCFLAGLLVYVSLFLSTFEVGKCGLFAVQAGRQASGILAWVQGVEQQAAGGKRSTCFVQLRCCARLGGGYPVILWIHGPWKIWKQATGIWRWTIWGYHLVI